MMYWYYLIKHCPLDFGVIKQLVPPDHLLYYLKSPKYLFYKCYKYHYQPPTFQIEFHSLTLDNGAYTLIQESNNLKLEWFCVQSEPVHWVGRGVILY